MAPHGDDDEKDLQRAVEGNQNEELDVPGETEPVDSEPVQYYDTEEGGSHQNACYHLQPQAPRQAQ
jgi:hypothetical protein